MSRLPAYPVAMDGRMLMHDQPTGVGTYARGLRQAQQRIAGRPLVLSDRDSLDAGGSGGRAMRWLRAISPLSPRAAMQTDGDAALLVARDVFRLAQVHIDIYSRLLTLSVPGPPGIMHWTYPVPIRIEGWANLYTVHDLIPLRGGFSPIDPRRHRRLLDRIAESAAALVTVSDASADEIAHVLHYPATRIHNCGQAVDPPPIREGLPAGLRPRHYLLALGSVEWRKNLTTLVRAYGRSGVELPLVIAGPEGWRAPDLDSPGIVRLPYLPAEQVGALLSHARALVMPSLAEGFGLPVVEAMALGTPVITSDIGALKEVAGHAALLVDPNNVDAMAEALRRIVADDALREALVAGGHDNAERFTLERFVEKLGPLYDLMMRSVA